MSDEENSKLITSWLTGAGLESYLLSGGPGRSLTCAFGLGSAAITGKVAISPTVVAILVSLHSRALRSILELLILCRRVVILLWGDWCFTILFALSQFRQPSLLILGSKA